ncbi:hypothetical protein [Shouchella patagoniensis]|nr:hypothetical protein [Shouchella patagoniensis]
MEERDTSKPSKEAVKNLYRLFMRTSVPRIIKKQQDEANRKSS